jgi:hypothetical protein
MVDLIGDMGDLDDAIRMIHTEVYFSLTQLYDQEAINAGACQKYGKPTFTMYPQEGP